MKAVDSAALAALFQSACLSELEALKPGNVHIFSDGHGMVLQDFVRSAEAASRVIAQADLSVGQRIASAVDATWEAVACNTNLGIILLCAPLLHAAGQGGGLREKLADTLQGLTLADAVDAYRGILQASPGGLGTSAQHDVNATPGVTLLAAMQAAAGRDRIAWQYAHDFADIFDFGAARYRATLQRWQRPAWALTSVYLGFLARFADTHVARKHGDGAAEALRKSAELHDQALYGLENPKHYQRALLDFDVMLKARGINPGTSADLTVASLLTVELENRMTAVTLS